MAHPLDIAEFLIASWTLAGTGEGIPASRGILDRALKEAIKHDSCPSWVRNELNFADSRGGLRCVELPSLLNWSQRAQLTSPLSPSCHSAQILISENSARRILMNLNVSDIDAEAWGKHLYRSVEDVKIQ